jgi:hypothetical protein
MLRMVARPRHDYGKDDVGPVENPENALPQDEPAPELPWRCIVVLPTFHMAVLIDHALITAKADLEHGWIVRGALQYPGVLLARISRSTGNHDDSRNQGF